MVKLIIQWSVILRSCGEGGLTYEVKYVWFYPKKITIKIAALRYCNLNLKILSKVFCTIPTYFKNIIFAIVVFFILVCFLLGSILLTIRYISYWTLVLKLKDKVVIRISSFLILYFFK